MKVWTLLKLWLAGRPHGQHEGKIQKVAKTLRVWTQIIYLVNVGKPTNNKRDFDVYHWLL